MKFKKLSLILLLGVLFFHSTAQAYIQASYTDVLFSWGMNGSEMKVHFPCDGCLAEGIKLPPGAHLIGDNFSMKTIFDSHYYFPFPGEESFYELDLFVHLFTGIRDNGQFFYIVAIQSIDYPYWQNPIFYGYVFVFSLVVIIGSILLKYFFRRWFNKKKKA